MKNSFTAEDLGIDFPNRNVEMNFGECGSNCENEELSIFQKALKKSKDKKRDMLQDNVICPCKFKYAELGYTSSSQIDILKIGLEVNDGTASLKQVEDIYVLDEAYIDSTIERLSSVLSKFGYELTNEDLRDLDSILDACNRLVGRTARIKQYTKNDYKKYWFYTD